MMYHMKNIITYNEEISLPKCMYRIKNPNDGHSEDEIDIDISNQVIKFLKTPDRKMMELEQRQDQLLKKLDILYERIMSISSICNTKSPETKVRNQQTIQLPDEIVAVLSPDNLPWFIMVFLKKSSITFNVKWHIHSSVPNDKVLKVKAFMKKVNLNANDSKINLRLIFKDVSADSELKLSSLAVPIVGNVNILRYLSCVYSDVVYYNADDYNIDSLLDLCHVLERTPEKNKEAIIKSLFSQYKTWIYKDTFSIVDLAVFNTIKQWKNTPKTIPKTWVDKCEKLCL